MDEILEMLVKNKLPNVTLSMDQVVIYHAKFERLNSENKKLKSRIKLNDFAYKTIDEYEGILGNKVNEAFKVGWCMARTTNNIIEQLGKSCEQKSQYE